MAAGRSLMIAALTFDDGPSQWTAPILDLLQQHKARATFFVCGYAVAENAALLKRMVGFGCEVGVHSFDHPHLPALSRSDAYFEIYRTGRAIVDAGATPLLWRAPYLDLNDEVEEIARGFNLTHVGCDVIPGDWALSDPQQIAQRVLSELKDGDIVLLHDGIPPDGGSGTDTRQPTVDAVALLLDTPGVTWTTVSGLG